MKNFFSGINNMFFLMVATAFIAGLAFVNIDSAWADDHNWNGKLHAIGWTFSAITILLFIRLLGSNNKK